MLAPIVLHCLQLIDPVPSLSRQPEVARQLEPVLVENPKQGGEIELIRSLAISFLDRSLLLEAEPVYDVFIPPVV